MPLIYLRHPVHGVKIATMHLEAEHDERNGWEVFDPNEPAPEPAPEPVNALRAPRRRKEPELGAV